MNLIIPFYIKQKTANELCCLIEYDLESKQVINNWSVKRLYDTPYYRFPILHDVQGFMNSTRGQFYVFDKKNLYKCGYKCEWVDYNTCHWMRDKSFYLPSTPIVHLNQLINFAYDLPIPRASSYPIEYESLIEACAILDGELSFMNGEVKLKDFNFFTKTGRFHDIGASSIVMKREDKKTVRTEGLLMEIDFDGCHSRIIDKLVWGNILPRTSSAIDYLMGEFKTGLSRDEFKTFWNKTLYSESFKKDEHPLLVALKNAYIKISNPLKSDGGIFNYKIQAYEVMAISDLICTIPKEYIHSILFYTYDGILVDVKRDAVLGLMTWLKSYQMPTKINFLNHSFFCG